MIPVSLRTVPYAVETDGRILWRTPRSATSPLIGPPSGTDLSFNLIQVRVLSVFQLSQLLIQPGQIQALIIHLGWSLFFEPFVFVDPSDPPVATLGFAPDLAFLSEENQISCPSRHGGSVGLN
jgi:hypothetical protein